MFFATHEPMMTLRTLCNCTLQAHFSDPFVFFNFFIDQGTMDVHLVNHTSLDVLARLETSFLQLRDGFVASLLMLTQYTNTDYMPCPCFFLVPPIGPLESGPAHDP